VKNTHFFEAGVQPENQLTPPFLPFSLLKELSIFVSQMYKAFFLTGRRGEREL